MTLVKRFKDAKTGSRYMQRYFPMVRRKDGLRHCNIWDGHAYPTVWLGPIMYYVLYPHNSWDGVEVQGVELWTSK